MSERSSSFRTAVVFPGQGSQYAGMADPWTAHPASAQALEEASGLFGFDIVEASRDAERLDRTDVSQPAVFACDVAAWRVLQETGIEPVAICGHSLGEFAALVAAGAISFADAAEVVKERAAAMAEACRAEPGAMSALVGLSREEAEEVCAIAGRGGILVVANENGPKQTVVSGGADAIELAERLARDRGARPVRLRVEGAFHSPLMRPALERVRNAIARAPIHGSTVSVIPNAGGKPERRGPVIRDLLARQLLSPVRWERSMHSLGDIGIDVLVEAGPGDVLAKLARRALPGAKTISLGSPAEVQAFGQTLKEGALR
jgi:[acyl-carrier-protein] S-malonyltransferase